jgi:hypothetical protein
MYQTIFIITQKFGSMYQTILVITQKFGSMYQAIFVNPEMDCRCELTEEEQNVVQ